MLLDPFVITLVRTSKTELTHNIDMNNDYTFTPERFISIAPAALQIILGACSDNKLALKRYDCVYFPRVTESDRVRIVTVGKDGSITMTTSVNHSYEPIAKKVNKFNLFTCNELGFDVVNKLVSIRKGKLTLWFEFDPFVTNIDMYNDFVQNKIVRK